MACIRDATPASAAPPTPTTRGGFHAWHRQCVYRGGALRPITALKCTREHALQCRTGDPRSAQVASIPSMRILPAVWSNPSSWELATILSRVFQTTLCSSFKPASTQLANMLQNPCGINNNTDDVSVCPSFCFLVDIKSFPISANHGDHTATCPSHRGS